MRTEPRVYRHSRACSSLSALLLCDTVFLGEGVPAPRSGKMISSVTGLSKVMLVSGEKGCPFTAGKSTRQAVQGSPASWLLMVKNVLDCISPATGAARSLCNPYSYPKAAVVCR